MDKKTALDFLTHLQKQMVHENEHNNDCQMSPRFWVVGDYEWVLAEEGCGERHCIYDSERGESYTSSEFHENFELGEQELDEWALEEFHELAEGDHYAFVEWYKEHVDNELYMYEVTLRHTIKQDTFFITKKEARQHIEMNKHHYSEKVHTYAMTAWRSPQVEKLFEILMNSDFEKWKE